jgi:hypothetical protein
MSTVLCGLRACTRPIQPRDRLASAARLASLVSHAVSKRPIWLVEAAAIQTGAIHHSTDRRIVGEAVGVVDIL